jgi:hypothetical protein
VPAVTLRGLLQARGLTHVDFCSIDVEGSELDVLESIDFSVVTFGVIAVEDNYGNPEIRRALEGHGYRLSATLGQDLIYAAHSSHR